jgi:hypothetical protein
MALSPNGRFAYLTSANTAEGVTLISTAAVGTGISPIRRRTRVLGMFTGGVAANGDNAYVAIREANKVAILNGVTGELWDVIADVGHTPGAPHPDVVSAICRPQDVAITPDGVEVWVAFICGLEGGGVAVIRHLTDRVVGRVQTQGPSWDVAITRDGAKAFVANWSPIHPPSTGGLSSVSGISTASRTEDHRVELAASGARSPRDIATQPPGVALDPVGDSFADLAERTFGVWFETERKEVFQLYRYLNQPWRQLVLGKPSEAITQLKAFKGRVQSLMTAKRLTIKDGLTLIGSVDAVIALLVGKPPPRQLTRASRRLGGGRFPVSLSGVPARVNRGSEHARGRKTPAPPRPVGLRHSLPPCSEILETNS